MIVIFGGTTEGRRAAAVCDKAAKPYLYATKGADQQLATNYSEQITGAMNAAEITTLIKSRGAKLIIDAAHPYAEILHKNISQAAILTSTPTIRFERLKSEMSYEKIHTFESLQSAIDYICREDLVRVLALTGVKSAKALSSIAQSHDVTLRIMDREESQQLITKANFPLERVIYYEIGAEDNFDSSIASNYRAILTKESGSSGGFEQKLQMAKMLDIPLLVVSRPQLPPYSAVVFGEHGIRRAIEQLLPHHFELRSGFTTGSAATAAIVAALRVLCSHEMEISAQEIILPNGEPISIPIKSVEVVGNNATATVIKDAGDDPDATHNIEIVTRVSLSKSEEGIKITGGEGVGVVTLPGIGIEVGLSAINPVPRQMIRKNIERLNLCSNVNVEISVPEGVEIAKKTFNPRLGIVGGISILGTSGIVQPFSLDAFIESIHRQIEVSKALGGDIIVINSGAMSERFIKAKYPDFAPHSYIHYGNMIGETIRLAAAEGIKRVILGVMIGKAVKLAAGALDTHSKHVVMDREFLSNIALEAECSTESIAQIAKLTTARQLWTIIPKSEYRYFEIIKERCYEVCLPLLPDGELEILLISEHGDIII